MALLLLLAAGWAAAILAEEPLRRSMERQLNARLSGYRVRIGGFDLHPLSFGWELEDVVLVQQAKPDPPVARIAEIRASVQWTALIFGAVVADVELVRPVLHLTLAQAEAETEDRVPVQERGWQDAVQALHPFKINAFRISDGDVTYVEPGPYAPMRVEHLNVITRNIRNVRSGRGRLPSPVHVDAWVLHSGTLRADGDADFLATPQPALRLGFSLQDLDISWAKPALRHAGLSVDRGRLSGDGSLEHAPDGHAAVRLRHGLVRDLALDYHLSGPGAAVAARGATATVRAATRSEPAPTTTVRADEIRVERSELGIVDPEAKPPWRLFLSGMQARIAGLDTRPDGPPGHAVVDARFQGSGPAHVEAHFQPPTHGPAFDTDVRIEGVDLRSMNDLLRATGGFDVASGTFALYSEMAVRNGRVDGYVKPLFDGLEVYSLEQDARKPVLRQAYEGLVGAVGALFRNHSSDTVATMTSISGPIEQPQASTWEIVVALVRNAFVKAILPGLEKGLRRD